MSSSYFLILHYKLYLWAKFVIFENAKSQNQHIYYCITQIIEKMHQSSLLRMEWFENFYASTIRSEGKIKVLDIGSCDVNGSYRNIFSSDKYSYFGLDMVEGPNVDIVLPNPYCWSQLETDSFDVVISGQAFEHIEFFWVTMLEIARVLKPGGFVCIIAPNGFVEHRYPVDCYRFFTDGMVALAKYVSLEPLHAHTNLSPSENCIDWYSDTNADAMLVAKKNYIGDAKIVDLLQYKCIPSNHIALAGDFVAKKKATSYCRNIYKKLVFKNRKRKTR